MLEGKNFQNLPRVVIILPSRQACFSAKTAFLQATSNKYLLSSPHFLSVESSEKINQSLFTELFPAIPSSLKQALLTKFVSSSSQDALLTEQASSFAASLIHFLEEIQIERVDFEQLLELIPSDYSSHWQVTLGLLTLLIQVWPIILEEEGFLDPFTRRSLIIQKLITSWKVEPVSGPVLIAGIVCADSSFTELISVIIAQSRNGKQGALVLPGLDLIMDEMSWDILDETHPQFGIKILLENLGVPRYNVEEWLPILSTVDKLAIDSSCSFVHRDRLRLISEAMKPTAVTDLWQCVTPFTQQALIGVERIDCPTLKDEALIIAVRLRNALEKNGWTSALVTPDRTLARRVIIELERWGIQINDLVSTPLQDTNQGTFLRLTAALLTETFSHSLLLTVLKHPLSSAGYEVETFRKLVWDLELRLLRRSQHSHFSIHNLRELLELVSDFSVDQQLYALLTWLEAATVKLTYLKETKGTTLSSIGRSHILFSEALATTVNKLGKNRLWQCESGNLAARCMANLLECSDTFPFLLPCLYLGVLEAHMGSYVFRPSYRSCSRLFLLDPLEIHLQQVDFLVIGGANEGNWPSSSTTDLDLNYSIRELLGLPILEHRVGFSAHNFLYAFCAPYIILTRSEYTDNILTVPSRWILRLEAVLQISFLEQWRNTQTHLLLARMLDWPKKFKAISHLAQHLPTVAQLKKLSLTEIETLLWNPYIVYTRHVLQFHKTALFLKSGASNYGNFVHRILEDFSRCWPDALPSNSKEALLETGKKFLTKTRIGIWPLWWNRFKHIAIWVSAQELNLQKRGNKSLPEACGWIALPRVLNQPFVLTGRADRIMSLSQRQSIVIDYKTGIVPSLSEVVASHTLQLPLEASITLSGGFFNVEGRKIYNQLLYWHLIGTIDGSIEKSVGCGTIACSSIRSARDLIAFFEYFGTSYEDFSYWKMLCSSSYKNLECA